MSAPTEQATLEGLNVDPWVGVQHVIKTTLHPGDGLLRWYWKMGTEGIDPMAMRARRQTSGSGIHSEVERLASDEYAEPTSGAGRAYQAWRASLGDDTVRVHVERHFQHNELRYRGRIDHIIERLDEEAGAPVRTLTVTDFKNGKRIYRDAHFQVAAYIEAILADPHEPPAVLKGSVVLLLDDGTFEEETTTVEPEEWRALLLVYRTLERLAVPAP